MRILDEAGERRRARAGSGIGRALGLNNKLIGRVRSWENALELRAVEAKPEGRKYVPVDRLDRMVAGEHPLRVFPEHRGLTILALSENPRSHRATFQG